MQDVKQHSATYQVQSFLASEKSYEIDLLPIDIVILYTISRYLDMPKKECFAKQNVLARECRIQRFYFARRCDRLVKLGLLFRYMRGKLYMYELGSIITGMEE